MWGDFQLAQQFRSNTLDYVSRCLGIPGESLGLKPPNNAIIRNFGVIGEAIGKDYDAGTS